MKTKNMNHLAEKVTRLEKGKKEVNIAQVKEILKVTSKLCVKEPAVIGLLIKNGYKK